MIPTTINERWTLLLPEHRAVRAEWPVWEKERLAAMHEVLAHNGTLTDGPEICRDLVYDIGAEEGDFPALWASWGADVVLVEPNPKVWPNIRAIFEANELEDRLRGWWVGFAGDSTSNDGRSAAQLRDWIEEHVLDPGIESDVHEAVGAAAYSPARWPQCAYGRIIGDHGFLVLPERPDCPSRTIDELAVEYGEPTVITIDVEGAELTVLRGAVAVLSESRPAVFVSVHIDMPWIDEKYPGDTGDKVAEYMQGLGYAGRHLATDHEEHWEWRHPEGR